MCVLNPLRSAVGASVPGVRRRGGASTPPAGIGRGQRGLSIIELMVGLVVAMLVGMAATSTAVIFTASQRQGIGVGGVAVNANTALAALKNDAATAGLGFFGDSRYLCSMLNLSVGATASWDGASFAPVRVTSVAAHSDRVDVLQATRVEAGATVLLKLDTNGSVDASVKSYLPAQVGDAVLVSPDTTGSPCLVRTVTGVTPSTNETPQVLSFAATGTHNGAAFTTNPTYPRDTGGVTLLGAVRWNRYRLDGTNLILERPLDGGSAIVARNVMAFRAQYGISAAAAGSTTLETWQDATGTTFGTLGATGIPRVRAVRIGIVTRSPQKEKVGTSGNCEASAAKPRDPLNAAAEIQPDVSDWQCYRFRSAVLVIPMRNIVIGLQ